jgi:excinuclease ABC subunit B
MAAFELASSLKPTGDQPKAIEQITDGIQGGERFQTLLGVTGSGKTFTMANVVQNLNRPTLVLAHNKTLAAQLYSEFKEYFPKNAVEYFVSYYDYYQPEAYVPRTDTFIEKDAEINEEIDKLRHAATRSLLTRRDTLIVASVSCIFGLGTPEEYQSTTVALRRGESVRRDKVLRQLIDIQYDRNDMTLVRGTFRVRGDTLEVFPAYEEIAIRIEFFGDEIERIVEVDPLTGEMLVTRTDVAIFPAKHFVTTQDRMGRAIDDIQRELEERVRFLEDGGRVLEAARLRQRTLYDIEMMQEAGYCAGIENYSMHISGRQPGDQPSTLLDYFPDDFLLFVDESHITLPQVRGMFGGDRSRKDVLVEHGFRLPSARENRPLTFDEFVQTIGQAVFVSATPGPYEYEHSSRIIEQVIRPTGLVDPAITVRPTKGQVDDLLGEINQRVAKGERTLVTTLTKRMAEDLSDYLKEMGVRTHYLHSEIDTLERIEILRDLRLGIHDVVVGINLLREGLDLPEVSLVAILDADKEGYLRSEGSLIQTVGRAARHVDGHVIMYADKVTRSMKGAIDETYRRREIQVSHNLAHGIEPRGIVKEIKDLTDRVREVAEQAVTYDTVDGPSGGIIRELPRDEIVRMVKDLESQMKKAARDLEFEKAALLRDQVVELRRMMESDPVNVNA